MKKFMPPQYLKDPGSLKLYIRKYLSKASSPNRFALLKNFLTHNPLWISNKKRRYGLRLLVQAFYFVGRSLRKLIR